MGTFVGRMRLEDLPVLDKGQTRRMMRSVRTRKGKLGRRGRKLGVQRMGMSWEKRVNGHVTCVESER